MKVMKLNVYAIYDSAAQAFDRPFFMHNDGLAVRAFSDAVNDEKSNIHRHPEHYSVYKIGTFDDKTAQLEKEDPPRSVALAINVQDHDAPRFSTADISTIQEEISLLKDTIEKRLLNSTIFAAEVEEEFITNPGGTE
jgi:phosphatidylethanolamine-binding protein (PEBP) family uncharacterized protein